MKTLLAWLFGTVTARITGAQPEDFLNLCARENLVLWRMVQRDLFTLEVQVTARQYARLCQLAQGAQCGVELEKRQGLPYFFLRFRRRYALLAGVALCLVLFAIGSRTVLTIEVTGNETVTREEIISQLRLCGVSVGTYGPGIPIREVENRMMMAMDALSYFSLNLHGTRAEVIVREKVPKPDIVDRTVPSHVVSAATGIITHMEVLEGQPLFQEGDTVLAGEILISGVIDVPEPQYADTDLGTRITHAMGNVWARTWRTLEARIPLEAQVKSYTGEKASRWTLSILGHRIDFFGKSGISFPEYDKITDTWALTLPGGREMPLALSRETCRAYTLAAAPVDADAAERLLEERLLEALRARLGDGEVVHTSFSSAQRDGRLEVTLQAECTEEIGRFVPLESITEENEAEP